ncbi:sigma-70 family RNA polymerase sigma factor [Alkalihalobacterium sp. APHAB7]|uniref:sigma-70 family RNA polymerase sigma factor n=1 Tax=Alkalihalobacterium sp. APHAB7 TaxID=3402081 RepID=UPI003AAE5A27
MSSYKALSYIFSIAMNESKKVLKKKGKEQVISINDDRFWNIYANDHDTEPSVLTIEMNNETVQTISQIQEVYKQLLLLKYELELSYKEIGLLLGMKEGTIKTYLFRARKEFQKKWRNLLMSDYTGDIFDEKKIKKAIKKGKTKSIITIVLVSFLVFVVLTISNFAISAYFSKKAFERRDAYVRLTTPNGYISETIDSTGILGGISNYKVSKDMKRKAVVIEQNQYSFGLFPSTLMSRGHGGSIGVTGEDWQFQYKENGWREMMFFHPNVSYKKYNNDEELINSIEGDKIYEVALSFDKPYKQSELPVGELPKMTWFWINTYTDSQIETFQEEVTEYDWSATFIREREALGFSAHSTTRLDYEYNRFLELLQTSFSRDHHKAFSTLDGKKVKDIEILGIVVYGTKEQILEIMEEPIIKAASLGGIIDNY